MTLEEVGIGLFVFWCVAEIVLFVLDEGEL